MLYAELSLLTHHVAEYDHRAGDATVPATDGLCVQFNQYRDQPSAIENPVSGWPYPPVLAHGAPGQPGGSLLRRTFGSFEQVRQ